jgi:hypothetical protein
VIVRNASERRLKFARFVEHRLTPIGSLTQSWAGWAKVA